MRAVVETDMSRGGRPVVRIVSEEEGRGPQVCYLSVTRIVKGVKADYNRNVFLSIEESDIDVIIDALRNMKELARAAGSV